MYTKMFEMYGVAKTGVAWLMLAAMFTMAGGAEAAALSDCAGSVTLEAPGVVKCAGQPLLSNCSGVVLIDSAGAISCVVTVTVPTCTLTASPTSISSGQSSTLTAACPGATSYVWTGGTCVGTNTSTTCAVTPAATTSYTVKGVNTAGTSAAATAAVTVTSTQTATAPPTCQLSQQAGMYPGSTYLVASCNPVATTYGWSANAAYNGMACSTSSPSCLVNPSAETIYTMTGSNSKGAGNTASATVTLAMSCTLTANPSSIVQDSVPSVSSTLTASCTPAAASYSWTGGTCAGNTATCTVTPAATTAYTVVGSGTGTASATKSVTVTPPSCTLTASKTTIGEGDTSRLTASCNPATANNTYTWSGTCAVDAIGNICDVSPGLGSNSYTVNGTGANTAQGSATVTVLAPYCTLTASPASVAPNGASTLTASCSPAVAAGSYIWSGGTCALITSATCNVTPAATTPYTATGGGGYTQGTATVTVVAPTCTLTASPANIAPNGPSTLTASCTPAAASYNWTGGTCAGSNTSATCAVTPASTTAYTVQGVNTAGTGNTVSATVNVSSTPAGCTVSPLNWPPGLAAYPGGTPGHSINDGEMQAFSMTQVSHAARTARLAYSTCSTEYSISVNACEWGTADLRARGCTTQGMDPMIVEQTSDQPPLAGTCMLNAGQTYYYNVRPATPLSASCTYFLTY